MLLPKLVSSSLPSTVLPTAVGTNSIFASRFFRNRFYSTRRPTRVLITGALGQLGIPLGESLRGVYGRENVILSDVKIPDQEILEKGPFRYADVTDYNALRRLIVDERITDVVHFAALLSGVGELNPSLAIRVNVEGLNNVLNLAKEYKFKCFAPSSIAAFGPETPRVDTPDLTLQRPTTIYGVSKVYLELLGNYFHKKFGVDFRSVRYPGILSASEPGGGTTDYAIFAMKNAAEGKNYESFLKPDASLPMMYIDDCIRASVEFMQAPSEKLTQRTYNLGAISFGPAELEVAIKKIVPSFQMTYNPDYRQAIAETWPMSMDDSQARKDWGWNHEYDLDKMTKTIIDLYSKSQ